MCNHLTSWFTEWHGWDWRGWEALVAIGTLCLAGSTGYLAIKTRGVATETRDLAMATSLTADADQQALAAAVAPLLVDNKTPAVSISMNPKMITLLVRSVGAGAAVLTGLPKIILDGGPGWAECVPPQIVIPAGEDLPLDFAVDPPTSRAVVEVAYTDVGGRQARRTRLLLVREGMQLFVRGFALYEGLSLVEPTLVSGLWRPKERVPG